MLENENLNDEIINDLFNENKSERSLKNTNKEHLQRFTRLYLNKYFNKNSSVITPFPGLLNPPQISFSCTKLTSLLLIIAIFLVNPVFAQTATLKAATLSLYAKAGSGDPYTLYPEGLAKENANISSFNGAKLDPLEENIYFYDSGLKIISKINLASGKVSRVIGKPKANTISDFKTGVSFSDANFNNLKDFTFDKYGNIFILIHGSLKTDSGSYYENNPIILKASFKDNSVKEVMRIDDQFRYKNFNNISLYGFSLSGITYDNDKYIYLYGTVNYPDFNYYSNYYLYKGHAILRYDPSVNVIETYGLSSNLPAFSPSKISFDPSQYRDQYNNPTLSLKGLAFDKSGNLYLSRLYSVQQPYTYTFNYYPFINKINTTLTSPTFDAYLGDGTGTPNDIGDGGQASGAYTIAYGTRFICNDVSGDILVADAATNKIRRIYKTSGLISTVAGGGTETLAFGQSKAAKSVALTSPSSIFVDKLNNLYIVEQNRILIGANLVTYVDKPIQIAKVASLAISKIAGNEVVNPKGELANPDLSLDYSYAGNQVVEVTANNIPDGTNVKLITTNADGSTAPDTPSSMLANGIASIPIKIDAGVSKVIKAESDPFIPAPGVYLSGTEPMIAPGTLPPEPVSTALKRNDVNLITRNSMGDITGNLVPDNGRFSISTNIAWGKYQRDSGSSTIFAGLDPDNLISDATLIDFSSSSNPFSIDIPSASTGKVTFSIWLKTTGDTFQIPIGIGPACPNKYMPDYFSYTGWEGCRYLTALAQNNIPQNFEYQNITVTPTWQKFSVTTTNTNLINLNKQLFLGGLTQPTGKKLYAWGARAEIVP